MNNIYIPDSLRSICDIIGPDETRAILNSFSGQRLTIPKKTNSNNKLADILSSSNYTLLTQMLAGLEIDVPLGREPIKPKILHYLENTELSHAFIAKQCQTTLRYVKLVAQEYGLNKDTRQGDLFND